MMNMKKTKFGYFANEVYRMLSLPYKQNNFEMIVVLPQKRFDLKAVQEVIFDNEF